MPFCKKCGSELESSDAFCPMCGEKNDLTVSSSAPAVNVVNQPQPVQPAPVKQEPSVKAPKTAKKKRTPLIIILCVGIPLIIGAVVTIILITNNQKAKSDESYYPDINKYYSENAEIKSVDSVKKSKSNLSEKEVTALLKERGFTDYPVVSSYSIDGEYADPEIISENSSKQHPVYETYYVTSKNELWVITVMDGEITASPSTYNVNNSDSVPVLVSEKEEIVGYDSRANKFYRTIPKATTLRVRIIERIDAKTLESIKLEG